MNLEQINTPQDLIEQNNVETDQERVKKLIDSVIEEGPETGLFITKVILEKLETFHKSMLDEKIEEGDHEQSIYWTVDLTRLENVISILDNVKL